MKLVIFALLVSLPIQAQVVLSEIMFDLVGVDNPNEFVEIFNLSPLDTIDLSGWQLSDARSLDSLVDAGLGMVLLPQSYVLIFEQDYDIASGLYSDLIPDSVLIVKVDDNSIGKGLSKSDSLFLINAEGDTIDLHGWQDVDAPGFSLERIRLDRPSEAVNWTTSLDSLGTPGSVNSVAPHDFDAAISPTSVTHSPASPAPGQTITLSVIVLNIGTQAVVGTVKVSENNEILGEEYFGPLGDGDSLVVQIQIVPLSSGIHNLQIHVHVTDDSNLENNLAQYQLAVQFPKAILTVNEFLYAPDPGIVEFIEFTSLSAEPLDLTGWGFSDSNSGEVRLLPAISIPPGSYLVTSKDSSLLPFIPSGGMLLVPENGFPSLNNSGDAIYLFDPTGYIIDSLIYASNWGGNNGRSLEKLNPSLESSLKSNWGTCVAALKMTPGTQNSIYLEALPPSGSVTLDPNPFSPDGDGYEDLLRISYNLPFSQAYLTILIFDSVGRAVRTLTQNLATGSQGVVTWDGLTDRNRRARIGIYVLKVSAVEAGTRKSTAWVKTAVLAKPLR